MSTGPGPIHKALEKFAADVTRKFAALAPGEPEDQLRGPTETLVGSIGTALGHEVVAKGESRVGERIGKPDYAIVVDGLLCGYLELKAPGIGANPARFKGHAREQWQRFRALPNLVYSDGNEWSLYQNGERVGRILSLPGDVSQDGKGAVDAEAAEGLEKLFERFLAWEPIVPANAQQLAELLAPLCRMLRDDVMEALGDPESPLVKLAGDWRELLFPDADNEEFADAYAQTVTYALLLARSEGAKTLDLGKAVATLQAKHSLLSRALQVLTEKVVADEIGTSLRLLQRVIDRVDPTAFASGGPDPWLYFYEDFLGAYDPKLRKDAGVYYTPVPVVRAQVRLVDELLRDRLNRQHGFAHADVMTLDPAVGTGTYLLGAIDHALRRIRELEGDGAVPGRATRLGENLHGFEIMVGPYAVAELRVSRALEQEGAALPADGPKIYLTDTLESPTAIPTAPPLFLEPIAKQHANALRVKESVPVLACLGNPPYDRHPGGATVHRSRTGGWVRYGEKVEALRSGEKAKAPILDAFLKPARDAGYGGHLKNVYNLYVYFWRWALWKVFESSTAEGPGIVSFISASSYLSGPGFVGMREHLRRLCDEVWIIDLGGEGRGPRTEENVFAIQTPVAIAVAARLGESKSSAPAQVRYTRIKGSRDQKLARLDDVRSFADLEWEDCSSEWHAPFRPIREGRYFEWPAVADLFPWQQSGMKPGRTWPIAPDGEALKARWKALLDATGARRRELFKDSPTGRKVGDQPPRLALEGPRERSISDAPRRAPMPSPMRYAFRSFDRQWLICDARLIDRPGPPLWLAHGERQLYLTTLLDVPLGRGPAVTIAADIPDLHHFRGSFGGKGVMPLWRKSDGTGPNVAPAVLVQLSAAHGSPVSPEDFLAYCYGILAHAGYTARFADELDTPGPRVPITKDPKLFVDVVEIGRRLIWLHTYGTRFIPKGRRLGHVPAGKAKCVKAVSNRPSEYPEAFSYDREAQVLSVGDGRFAPVSRTVWEYEVSGLEVVDSWLGYRMRDRHGRKSSPLDEIHPERWSEAMTSELLQLLWVVEETIAVEAKQAELLDAVLSGPLVTAAELPPVPEGLREPPGSSREVAEQQAFPLDET